MLHFQFRCIYILTRFVSCYIIYDITYREEDIIRRNHTSKKKARVSKKTHAIIDSDEEEDLAVPIASSDPVQTMGYEPETTTLPQCLDQRNSGEEEAIAADEGSIGSYYKQICCSLLFSPANQYVCDIISADANRVLSIAHCSMLYFY